MTHDALFAALEEWLRAVNPDIEIIEENPEAPRPAPPYIVLGIVSPAARDGLDGQRFEEDGTVTVEGQRRLTAQVTYIGTRAVERLAAFRDVLDHPRVNGIFERAGFSVPNDGDILDITVARENKFEERAVLDLFVQYAVTLRDTSTGFFNKTEVNETLIGG